MLSHFIPGPPQKNKKESATCSLILTFLLEKVMQRVSQNLHIERKIHRLRRDVIRPERVSQLGIAECNTVTQCHSWGLQSVTQCNSVTVGDRGAGDGV